jgi:MFS family permease
MIDLSKHPSLKYILFGDLYFSEGLILALTTVILVLFFTEKNILISTTTIVGGIVSLPWIMKFVFGPTIDFFGKYGRRNFIFLGGIVGAISIFLVAFIDPNISIALFTSLLLVGHFGIVLLDVSADAWAIQTTKKSERGKINSAMTTGFFSGTAIGSIIFTYIATHFGFETVFLTCSLLIVSTIILPIFVREKRIEIKRKMIGPLLFSEFKKRNTQLVALFGFVVTINFGVLKFVIPEYMSDVLVLDKVQIGALTALYYVSIVIGSFIGGIASDIFGRKKILYITLSGLLTSSCLLILADTWERIAIIYTVYGFFMGASLYSAASALLMDITNPKISGSQYSFLASISNLGGTGIGMISGTIVLILGYNRFFLYSAWIILSALLILYFIKEKKN